MFRIKRDPAKLFGIAVARSTQPFDAFSYERDPPQIDGRYRKLAALRVMPAVANNVGCCGVHREQSCLWVVDVA